MQRNLLLVFLLIPLFKLQAQNFSGPESVEFDSANNRYLISNTVSHQIIAYQNGVKSLFATLTGSGPHGLEIVGDTLYCCNGASIRALNLSTGALVYTKSLGASFLNGITHDPAGNLYISDFSAKKIYRLNTLTRKFNVFVASTVSTPNGIVYDPYDGLNPRLVFCNWGSNAAIKKINLLDSTVSTLTSTNLSNCDGICKGKNGYFYVSSWGNQSIQRFDSTFSGGNITVVSGLSNPADIVYNLNSDTLGVPNASSNTVSFHYLGNPNSIYNQVHVNQFQIYPNPNAGILIVESKVGIQKISLYNSVQQELFTREYLNEKKLEILLPKLPSGSYFLQINNSSQLKPFLVN